MTIFILALSTILQFVAAFLSVRLIKVTGRKGAWTLFALVLSLMAVRRAVSLYHMVSGETPTTTDLSSELIALTISIILVMAVYLIDPVFRRFQYTREALKRSEENYQEIVNFLPQAIIETNPDNEIVFTNEAGHRLFGEVDNLDKPVRLQSLVIESDRERGVRNLQALLEEKQTGPNEYTMISKDGELIPVLAYSTPIRDGDCISGIRLLVIDISDLKRKEEKLNILGRIFNTSLNEILVLDTENYAFIQANKAALSNLGYSWRELQHLAPQDINPDLSIEKLDKTFGRLRSGERKKVIIETRHQRKDGSFYDVEVHLQQFRHDDISYFVAMCLDITERKKSEAELRKLSQGVEASPISIVITDTDGLIEYVNPQFSQTTGYTKNEVIGQNISLLRSDETPAAVTDELWGTVHTGGVWKGELRERKKDGSLFWARVAITGVRDEHDRITHVVSSQEDVTHEYELSEQLNYQASHDSLTGLVNRREFERRTDRLLGSTRRDNSEHALCYMDLDQFKVVNDTCGHAAGDEMMRQIAMLLQGIVRKRDTLARLGGDEFGVLMEHCSSDHAYRVASNLQKAIQDYQFSWEGHVFRVGVSIGLVAITEAFPNLGELLKQADAACYMAKDLGRNRIHVYHGEDATLAHRQGEMQWVTRIYRALEQNRYVLFAQSIIPLGPQEGLHYELLIRMQEDDGKLVPPGAFLPAAERYNLIEQLDAWVIENAFRMLRESEAFLEEVRFISINLSGQSMTRPDILKFIVDNLEKYRIPANKICFEITETTAIANLSAAVRIIATLRDLGCFFALDDFGSGLSSFGYLKNLPVDFLKIDGMFVKDIVEDPIDHAMVKSINEIGQVMNMKTIAEFVENDEIKGMLREIGVDYAQGYGVAKPVPFVSLLSATGNAVNSSTNSHHPG